MKVLVTGATGFIGDYVIRTLLAMNNDVIASSTNFNKAKEKNWFNKVTFIEHRIAVENNHDLYKKFGQPDLLIHLAWEGLPNYNKLYHFEKVLWDQYSFLKDMILSGLKDLTVTGTCFEYGFQTGELKETDAVYPSNAYSIAKNSLRAFLEEFHKVHSFNFKWIRLFYMYGKGQSKSSILSQLDAAIENGLDSFNMSAGDQIRDYLPIEKVADNIVSIAAQNKVNGVINCASGKPITVKALVEQHLLGIGSDIKLNLGYYPYSPFEPMAFWGSTEKLKQIQTNDIL